MTRWLILILVSMIWATMMVWVYREYNVPAAVMDAQSDRLALDSLFDERATEREVWRIYFDPRLMRPPSERAKPYAPEGGSEELRAAAIAEGVWAGAREGEVLIGTREVKQSVRGFTRAEVSTYMKLQWPKGFGEVPFQFAGDLVDEGTMRFSRERGLEELTAKARVFAALEMRCKGFRDGDALKLSLAFLNGPDKKIIDQELTIPLTGSCAPTFGLSPFFFNPNVNVGSRWTVATLNMAPQDRGTMRTMTVRVTDKRTIQYLGRPAPAYEAVAHGENSSSMAYYSPDGQVLVQYVQFVGLRLTMIREELREGPP